MTATMTEQTKKTWRDWIREDGVFEPQSLMTRQELVDELQRRGIDVSERTIGFWEKSGVLPHPVRQWHDGAVRAVYPGFTPEAVAYIRGQQDEGWSLSKIAAVMPNWYRLTAQHPMWSLITHQIEVDAALRQYVAALERISGKRVVKVRVGFEDSQGLDIEGWDFEVSETDR